MKKNMAIAMSAMMTAGAVVPAFAATEDVKTITVDTRTARGEKLVVKDGLIEREELNSTENKAEIEAAKKELETAKKELEAYLNEKQYAEIVNGEAVLKSKYTIKVNEEESSFKKAVVAGKELIAMDTTVVYDVINNETKKVEAKYEFVGLKKLDLDAEFGNGEANYKELSFDFAGDVNYAELAKIKYELNANVSKIKLEEINKVNKNGKLSYLELKVMLADGTEVARLTFENIEQCDEDAMAVADSEYQAIMDNINSLVEVETNGDIKSHWAKEQVLEAMTNGWIDTSVEFRPEDKITRAEFVKVVNRAFGIVPDKSIAKVEFSDVDGDAWYYGDVKAASDYGYINGYTDGTFKPDAPISREEAAKIIAALHNTALGNETSVETTGTDNKDVDVKTRFNDDASISAWADQSVEYLADRGIVNGYEEKVDGLTVNVFKPQGKISRAEAVVMMTRAFEQTPTPFN